MSSCSPAHLRKSRLWRAEVRALATGLALLSACHRGALATDHYLTIGGGYDATGNQLSLEANVRYLQDLLRRQDHPEGAHDVFFADGRDARRDLQFRPAGYQVPAANRWMARLFGSEKDLGLSYRNHEVPNIRGAATRANVLQWFSKQGQTLRSGDRLVIYVTAHGGRSRNDQRPEWVRLYLWQSPSLSVPDLAERLASLPADVPVILVMAQCYAGGFGHLLFKEGNAEKGDLDRTICGFFATTPDRPAAGCTADAEGDFAEYSGSFWAAHSGITRAGRPVRPADYDNDGLVSLSEAHTFALLTTESLDIPVKTSDVWLRRHSRFSESPTDGLLTKNAPFATLVSRAAAPERKVLTALSDRLDLAGDDKTTEARERSRQIQRERQTLAEEDRRLKQRQLRLKRKLSSGLKREWPELANPWDAASTRLVAEQADNLVLTIESLAEHALLERLWQQRREIAQKRFDLDKEYAWYQRFVQACESVTLAINLQRLADPALLKRYGRLVAAESASLQWQMLH